MCARATVLARQIVHKACTCACALLAVRQSFNLTSLHHLQKEAAEQEHRDLTAAHNSVMKRIAELQVLASASACTSADIVLKGHQCCLASACSSCEVVLLMAGLISLSSPCLCVAALV